MTQKHENEQNQTSENTQEQAPQDQPLKKESKNEMMTSTIKESYEITQNPEGKFVRKAVYHPFSSVKPETKEQKIKMMNLLNGDDEGLPMNENVGKTFELADVIFQPYDAINEDTGYPEFGVLTYAFSHAGEVFVTSSKSVYFTLKKVFQVFGEPHYTPEEAVKLQVVKKDGKEHKYIDLKIIG